MISQSTLRRSKSDTHPGDDYEQIANHYYNQTLHPTCAALRDASLSLAIELTPQHNYSDVLEVGCGKALLPQLFSELKIRYLHAILGDASVSMLSHSKEYASQNTNLMLMDATNNLLESNRFDFILSILGDPYNGLQFWEEISRLLATGGVAVFTTPSKLWSDIFRPIGQNSGTHTSEFETPEGGIVAPPSLILSDEDLESLLSTLGLTVEATAHRSASTIPSASKAPKLGVIAQYQPFASGYLVRKL